jgi:integrase/recombinase XerD
MTIMPRLPWEITLDQVLTLRETEHLLANVRSASSARDDDPTPAVDRLIIECLLFSGLRCSEFCILKLADTPGGNDGSVFRVRNRSEGRTVRLPTPIVALTRGYARNIRPFLSERTAGRPSDAFLLNERGRPYERTGLYRRVVSVLTSAGLAPKASVQLLRHTYGYLAYLRTGGNLLFVQRQLGHAHPMITAVYANLVEENDADLADAVASDPRASNPSPKRKRALTSRSSRKELTRA